MSPCSLYAAFLPYLGLTWPRSRGRNAAWRYGSMSAQHALDAVRHAADENA
jgi:hypothetical protein